jgi:anti-sigma regulatory factor (Ser/Thr protein kinase)
LLRICPLTTDKKGRVHHTAFLVKGIFVLSNSNQPDQETQRLLEFKEKIKTAPLSEIHKKIQLWIRRIDQFVTMGNKNKVRDLYNEFKIMMEVVHELSPKKKEKISDVVIQEKAAREIDLVKNSLAGFALQEITELRDVLFRFKSDDNSLEQIYDIAGKKFDLLPVHEMDKVNMAAALREAIGNAQRHGNKDNPNLSIEFHYLQLPDRLILRITDQGEGFDHRAMVKKKKAGDPLEEAREKYKSGGYGGLGIMLMLQCVDKIEYNDKGNQIILEKYFDSEKKEQ